MVVSKDSPPNIQSLPREPLGICVKTERIINFAHCLDNVRAGRWLIVQRSLDLLHACIKDLPGGDSVSARLSWIGYFEEILQKVGYAFLGLGLLACPVPFPGDAAGLDSHRHGKYK